MQSIKRVIKRATNNRKKIKCIDIRNGESFRFLDYVENKDNKKSNNVSADRFY